MICVPLTLHMSIRDAPVDTLGNVLLGKKKLSAHSKAQSCTDTKSNPNEKAPQSPKSSTKRSTSVCCSSRVGNFKPSNSPRVGCAGVEICLKIRVVHAFIVTPPPPLAQHTQLPVTSWTYNFTLKRNTAAVSLFHYKQRKYRFHLFELESLVPLSVCGSPSFFSGMREKLRP